ncbi:MAG: TetR/AcrR family transcriptional regulator C-terminal domain-containing protein [Lachnospiraceae bacterium]|nr:TetR/AcrR family transcriptional regulator C-terminal domain-containing protein [Lachnospiraceae bacterium]
MADLMKKAIKSTFLNLLEQKPLSQITVKMIVEECGIHRNSFYYHYPDLPALIEEIIKEEADALIERHPTIDSIEDALKAAVDFASKQRRAILHIYNSVNRDIFEKYLWHVCEYSVTKYGDTIFSGKKISPEDRELIGRFYACECFGLVTLWLSENMSKDMEKDIDRFCQLHLGMVEEMVRRSEKG